MLLLYHIIILFMSSLRRTFGLGWIVLYWLGTIIGAGIYVLVGKIAGEAGIYAPFSFLLAGVIATLSALTYAEMASRFPRSAGDALYIEKWFSSRTFAMIVWFFVITSWIVSAGVLSLWFARYFNVLLPWLPERIPTIGIITLLWGIAIKWINLSKRFISTITIISVIWLLLIIGVGWWSISRPSVNFMELIPPLSRPIRSWIVLGAFLSFYAFIGFEDMVNTSDEVKNPKRTMPLWIIIVLILSSVLYIAVALIAVLWLPIEQLAGSGAPLADLYVAATGWSPLVITIISLLSVTNSILAQIIMASRLLYGMAAQWWIHKFFCKIHPRTCTPVNASVVVIGIIILGALFFSLTTLARFTSFLLLVVFTSVNLWLLIIKYKEITGKREKQSGIFRIHWLIPLVACLLNIGLIIQQVSAGMLAGH